MQTDEYLASNLSNLFFNATQGDSISKDKILDSIASILRDYNYMTGRNIEIKDWRKK